MTHIDGFLLYVGGAWLAASLAIVCLILAVRRRDRVAPVGTGLAGAWGSRGCLDDPDSDSGDAHHALDELLDNERPAPAPRLNLTEAEVYRRFADIVEAEQAATRKRMREQP